MSTYTNDFYKKKFGLFVHFVANWTGHPDGRCPTTPDETVECFDVKGFADDVERMGVQYLIFTTWHWKTVTLFPSKVNEKWRPGNSTKRDLIGEIVDEVTSRGIDVILYIHPRDGHDFEPDEKIATGWGDNPQSPDRETFDNEKWNRYMLELIEEVTERYGDKISGFYLDGEGAFDPYVVRNPRDLTQVVDYLEIRRILKEKNPSAVTITNYVGNKFSCDYIMTEGYREYENEVFNFKNVEKWPVDHVNRIVQCYTHGWYVGHSVRGADCQRMSTRDMMTYTFFNASCSDSGGTCWPTGPYCEGNIWGVNVLESMSAVGDMMKKYSESIRDVLPSKSFPTVSGDTLEGLGFKFFTESEDGRHEYLHIMKMPEDGVITIPNSEDGAVISNPVCLHGAIDGLKLDVTDDGYVLKLSGTPDEFDTVIRFDRTEPAVPYECEWINDSDVRLKYIGWWFSFHIHEKRTEGTLGCYEADYSLTSVKDASVFFAFEGSRVEIYGLKCPTFGKADVFIDGINVGEADAYGDVSEPRALMFRSENLCGGIHSLEIVVRGDDGKFFTLDAIKVIK